MLKFIGSGSAFNTELGNTSAYYKEGDQLFLIDCGSDVFKKIRESEILSGVENIHVLITHSHSDHIGSLGDLILFSYFSMGEIMRIKTNVYSIGATSIKEILKLMGVTEEYYNYIPTLHTLETRLKQFKDFSIVEPYRNEHVDEIFSFGYVLEINEKKIYYSGDTNNLDKHVLNLINNGEIDYAYIDTCKADHDGNVHLSLRKLSELIDEDARERVYCMHLDESFDVEEAEEMGFNVVENSVLKEKVKMNYYEFTTPYYALIRAKDDVEATKEYIEVVAGEEGEFDIIHEECSLVPEYYASARFLLSMDGNYAESMDEVQTEFGNNETKVLLIDGSLI